MDDAEVDKRYVRLLGNVDAARELLGEVGEAHWAGWLARVHHELDSHDATGLRRLLGAYGGMGSLNDLVLTPVNGHAVAPGQVDEVNRTLRSLLSAAHDDAFALRRALG